MQGSRLQHPRCLPVPACLQGGVPHFPAPTTPEPAPPHTAQPTFCALHVCACMQPEQPLFPKPRHNGAGVFLQSGRQVSKGQAGKTGGLASTEAGSESCIGSMCCLQWPTAEPCARQAEVICSRIHHCNDIPYCKPRQHVGCGMEPPAAQPPCTHATHSCMLRRSCIAPLHTPACDHPAPSLHPNGL